MQIVACLFDPAQKARIICQPIFKPFLLRFKTNQHSGRLAVACDDDLLHFSFAKIAREIVLDFGEWTSLHSGFANCASHESASDLATIAKIWTAVFVTS